MKQILLFMLPLLANVLSKGTPRVFPNTVSLKDSLTYLPQPEPAKDRGIPGKTSEPYRFSQCFSIYNADSLEWEAALLFDEAWDSIRISTFGKQGNKVQLTGMLVPLSKRAVSVSSPIAFVAVPAHDTLAVWIDYTLLPGRIHPSSGVAEVYPTQAFQIKRQRLLFLQALFLGAMLIMGTYNLFLFLTVGDRSYLLYTGVLVTMGFIFMENHRLGFDFLWPEWPAFEKFTLSFPLFNILAGTTLTLFYQHFLQTGSRMPWMHRLLHGANALAVSFFLAALAGWHGPVFELTNFCGILIYSFGLIAGIISYRRGYAPSRYFLAGAGTSAFLTILYLANTMMEFLPVTWGTYPMQIGYMADLALFSFALADRINSLKNENDLKKQELLQQEIIREHMRIQAIRDTESKERQRIARELHDEVGADLSGMVLHSNLLQHSTALSETDKKRLQRIAEAGRQTLLNIQEIIWTLNSRNDHLNHLLAYISRYAYEQFELYGISGKVSFPEKIPEKPVEGTTRRNLFLLVKEALHNAIRHSGATAIELGFKIHGSEMDFWIEDNGSGFDPAASSNTGNGLRNMAERAAMAGGSFTLSSTPGHGTRISISIPGHPEALP